MRDTPPSVRPTTTLHAGAVVSPTTLPPQTLGEVVATADSVTDTPTTVTTAVVTVVPIAPLHTETTVVMYVSLFALMSTFLYIELFSSFQNGSRHHHNSVHFASQPQYFRDHSPTLGERILNFFGLGNNHRHHNEYGSRGRTLHKY
jgi:hypothetical protein